MLSVQNSEGGDYDFSTDGGDSLVMPQMVDLAFQGLQRSPRLAGQKRPNYACSVLKNFCAFGMVLAAAMSAPSSVFSHAHACAKSAVYQCATMNANFDQTLNSIHHMVLAAGQTHNEVYTFKDMLKEDDRADFVRAMAKEIEDHEKRGHCVAVPRLSMPSGTKNNTINLGIQEEATPGWDFEQAQSEIVCPWWNAIMVCQLLGNLCACCELDQHQVSFCFG